MAQVMVSRRTVPRRLFRRGSLATEVETQFIDGLADVWSAVASKCMPDSRLIIRFGALPSLTRDPESMIIRSLAQSRAGWLIEDCAPATLPRPERRQALHMKTRVGCPVREVDVTARLIAAAEVAREATHSRLKSNGRLHG